jgi:Sulfatase-modifying factor enzyme 1
MYLYRVCTIVVVGCLLLLLVLGLQAKAHHDKTVEAAELAETSVSQLLDIYECTRCHRLTSPHRLIGPSLWQLGQRADAAAIRASILTPDAVVISGYPAGIMRTRLEEIGFYDDIARQPAILERLVAYLAGQQLLHTATAHEPLGGKAAVHIPSGTVRQPDGRSVDVPAFSIDAAPVTRAQYALFIAAAGYTTKRYWDRAGWAVVVRRRKRTQPNGWDAERDQASEQPVVGVSWYEAHAYCHWAGKELPSELQWQRACQEVPTWPGAGERASMSWEWTAEAVWKGGQEPTGHMREACSTRVPSHPALDGQHTGFRCLAVASPAASTTMEGTGR